MRAFPCVFRGLASSRSALGVRAFGSGSRSRGASLTAGWAPQDFSVFFAKLSRVEPSLVKQENVAVVLRAAHGALPVFTEPADLATLLFGLGKLSSVQGSRRVILNFVRDWTAAATPLLPTFDASSLSVVILAMADVRPTPDTVEMSFFSAWARAATENFASMTPQELATTMHSLGRLTMGPRHLGPTLFQKWAESASRGFGGFSPQELADSVVGLSMSRVDAKVVGADVFVAWAEAAQRNLGAFRDAELASSLCSLGLLGVGETELGMAFFRAAMREILSRMAAIDAEHMVKIIRGLGKLRMVGAKLQSPSGDDDGAFFYRRWSQAMGLRMASVKSLRELSEIIDSMANLSLKPSLLKSEYDVDGLLFYRAWADETEKQLLKAVAAIEEAAAAAASSRRFRKPAPDPAPGFGGIDLVVILVSLADLGLGVAELGGNRFFHAWGAAAVAMSIQHCSRGELMACLKAVADLGLKHEDLGGYLPVHHLGMGISDKIDTFEDEELVRVLPALLAVNAGVKVVGGFFFRRWFGAVASRYQNWKVEDVANNFCAAVELFTERVIRHDHLAEMGRSMETRLGSLSAEQLQRIHNAIELRLLPSRMGDTWNASWELAFANKNKDTLKKT